MKKGIHMNYKNDVLALCACGASFSVGSTMNDIKVEICSKCHPFYSGTEKTIDSAGRITKFNKRRAAVSKQ